MGEYKHGSMDCTEQQKMFVGFIKVAAWVLAITAVILIILAIVGT